MPIPKATTRLNRRVFNPVMKQLAARAPGMAVVIHRGRTSGRSYETPVGAFGAGRRVTIALTYGPDVDWLRNVRAAGGCRLIRRGRARAAGNLRALSTEEGMARMPAIVRPILRVLQVGDFVELTECKDRLSGEDDTK